MHLTILSCFALRADYAAPEVLFGDIPFAHGSPTSFDIWSVGVLFLEVILGTHKVFQVRSLLLLFLCV
jgi:serine/threonine protein kinase